MIPYRFAVGDRVQLLLASYVNSLPQDVYSIERRLPPEANVYRYRVQRLQDGQERVVGENELVLMKSQQLGNAHMNATEAQLDLQRIRNSAARVRAHRATASGTNRGR